MATDYYPKSGPMRVQARQGSEAERLYFAGSALPQVLPMPKAIAPGIGPSAMDDLIYHGGKVVPQMEFQNIYLGGEGAWKASDIASIDSAIELAMTDRRLNNVMVRYFPGTGMSCDMRASFIVDGTRPTRLDEPDVQAMVTSLYDSAQIGKKDLESTLFNLILPSGTTLHLGNSSSTAGLGGYHGSLHLSRGGKKVTLYYSANVYSELQDNGSENGIVAFNRPWKNVVGTLYHEINEFRTDPDVNDAIEQNSNEFLGWNSRRGHEVGDQPIFVASSLSQVFKEVRDATGKRRIPVQFMYSNAVHGPEGPISRPHV